MVCKTWWKWISDTSFCLYINQVESNTQERLGITKLAAIGRYGPKEKIVMGDVVLNSLWNWMQMDFW